MKRSELLLIAFLALLCLGMAGGGFSGKGELKAEIRLKLYNQAIQHYEKAKALHAMGRRQDALQEIHKATKVIRAFPEAYGLARAIYLELGKQREAMEQEALFKDYGGDRGISLYTLNDQVAEEVNVRQKYAPPPDIQLVPGLLVSGLLAVLLTIGMIFEYRRLRGRPTSTDRSRSLILEPFPEEEEAEVATSWFFKICVFLLPGPLLFSLLILLGIRHYSDLVPILLFGWVMIDVGIYLIFFADLSGLSGFRSGRPAG